MPRELIIDCGLEGTPDGGQFDVCLVPANAPDKTALLEGIVPGQSIEAPFDIEEIHFLAREGGYWGLSFSSPPRTISGVIPKLPSGPAGWWHAAHGVAEPDDGLGEGVRIGVIDEALALPPDGSPIGHVLNLGGEAWDRDDPRGFEPRTGHSLAVCGLIGARAACNAPFIGIAPAAELVFAAAGEDQAERLDVARLANAIDLLVNDYQCDIISFSAGDCADPLPEIETAADAALDAGSLCFVAAGNLGGEARYPARYPECLAVGALGKVGLAPPNTFESSQEQASTGAIVDGLYAWCDSAQGSEVNYVGAGLAIFAMQQSGIYSVCGTSYAVPITAGLAAVILSADPEFTSLPRDRNRAKYAIKAINSSTKRVFLNVCDQGMVVLK